jgi:hypothetical protein
MDDVKFAILKLLAMSGQSLNRINLLGRSPGRGEIETYLKVGFDDTTRHLANRSFQELIRANLIVPTYSDLTVPDDWVRITPAGARALESGVLDELDAVLATIGPHLIEVRSGAWAALETGLPDSLRQAAHSGRELIDQTLKIAASDSEIALQPGFVPDATSRNGVTRAMRLKLIMKKFKKSVSESDVKIAEAACDLVLAIQTKLAASAHSRAEPQADEVRMLLSNADLALRKILL